MEAFKLTSSRKKPALVEMIATRARTAGFGRRASEAIAAAADELLMNAIFDAPVDDRGRPLHDRTARDSELALTGRAEVELRLAIGPEALTVTVIDRYGSLDEARVASALAGRLADPGSDSLRSGLGLGKIARSGGTIAWRCEPGSRTEVSARFRLRTLA